MVLPSVLITFYKKKITIQSSAIALASISFIAKDCIILAETDIFYVVLRLSKDDITCDSFKVNARFNYISKILADVIRG